MYNGIMKKLIPYIITGSIAVSLILLKIFSSSNKPDQNKTETEIANHKRSMIGQYSFGVSVCDEVSKDLVKNIINKPIEEVEARSTQNDISCSYYTAKSKLEHILIQVNFLSADDQKKGQEMLGRKVVTYKDFPLENFAAVQDDGNINAIYLVMTPNKYVRVDRTANTANNQQLIELARKVAEIIVGN